MESLLLLAMNVHSQFADLAMSMKEGKGIKLALSAKLDSSVLKVYLTVEMVVVIFRFLDFESYSLILEISGSPRVDGDEDEDEFDDLEHEFDYNEYEQHIMSRGIGRTASGITTQSEVDPINPEIPLLTYGQEVDAIIIFCFFILHWCFLLQILMKFVYFSSLILHYCSSNVNMEFES